MLLMFATVWRLQTLINIDNIKTTKSGIEIKIPEIIKTSRLGTCQPISLLPFLGIKEVCIAKTLLEYIECTKELRGMHKSLFILTMKSHKLVGVQTLRH